MRFAIFLALGFAAFMAVIWLVGRDPSNAIPQYKWNNGTIVRSVLSNQRGQIIGLRCYSGAPACLYKVRFVGLAITTHTHITSDDGDVSTEPLTAIDYMQEYELKDN
jgi:hypothetical protein